MLIIAIALWDLIKYVSRRIVIALLLTKPEIKARYNRKLAEFEAMKGELK